MGVRENKVEKYLHAQVTTRLNGTTMKWMGTTGAPDRIVTMPFIGSIFVEVKTTDGKLSPAQERCHRKIKQAGGTVYTAYGHEGVDLIIQFYAKEQHNAKTR